MEVEGNCELVCSASFLIRRKKIEENSKVREKNKVTDKVEIKERKLRLKQEEL